MTQMTVIDMSNPTDNWTQLECLDIWSKAAAIHASGASTDQFALRAEELAQAGLDRLGDFEIRRLGGGTRGRTAIIAEPRSPRELAGAWGFIRANWGTPQRMYAALAAAWSLSEPEGSTR
jgi:hypothetical protein